MTIKTARENAIDRLCEYAQTAEAWDLYEIVEWAFGCDDPVVFRMREELAEEELTDNSNRQENKDG